MSILFRNILLSCSILLFLIGIIAESINTINISILMLLIQNFWFALEKFSERVIFFSFNITILVFILGRPFISDLFNYQFSENGFYGTGIYDTKVIINIFIGIYISMLFLYLGNLFMEKRLLDDKPSLKVTKNINNDLFWKYFKITSKYFFFFLLIFRFIYLKESIAFVDESSYFELYTTYTTHLPSIVIKLSEIYIVPFFAFLVLKPTKREAAIPILLFLVEGTFSLGTGKRFGFILNIIIILIYFSLRNEDSKNKWLGKKEIVLTILAIPVLATILNIISYTRVGMTSARQNVGDIILEFFYKQGVTLKTLAYSDVFKGVYSDHTLYSLGPITEFLKNNTITKLFFDFPVYSGQTMERALNGDLFSHRLSYFIMPSGYLQGRGYGSSYIAELYVDFGFIGIAIGSFIFGLLFVVLYKGFNGKPFIALFSLILIRNLMMTSRSETTSFITASLTLGNIFCLVILLVLSFLVYNLFEKTQVTLTSKPVKMGESNEKG